MSFVGGKLQLKGVDVGVKKKKKKKKDKERGQEGNGELGQDQGELLQIAGAKVAKVSSLKRIGRAHSIVQTAFVHCIMEEHVDPAGSQITPCQGNCRVTLD
jgi:hypothetical protein